MRTKRSLTIDDDVMIKIDKEAEDRGLSLSRRTEQILKAYLSELEKPVDQMPII